MPSEITLLLERWRQGDETALNELMPLVYSELNRRARILLRNRRPNHTLQPTALVHEACLKLLGHSGPSFENRAHFLAVLSRAMRQVLVDHARAEGAEKRGGRGEKVPWDTQIELAAEAGSPTPRMLELDRLLSALESENPRLARLVEMHYFGGMTAEEAGVALDRSAHAVRHDLRAARAWLRRELARGSAS
jgi:RNA polymerase sigma-70 factor (ECF subfamily)